MFAIVLGTLTYSFFKGFKFLELLARRISDVDCGPDYWTFAAVN